MSYIEAILLGLVQGLAEFLPISSSGHLALLQHFFHVEPDRVLMFTVMLHIGTLASVFIMYWSDIWALIKEFFITIADLVTGKGLRLAERPMRKLGLMIIWATVPTALMGLLFNDFFEGLNSKLWAIGIGWLFTGFLLYFSERIGRAVNDIEKMNFRNGFFIGVLQGIAICPGVSRSGSTMVGGLLTGLKRDFAVRFAFLISIPSILGAAVLELPDAIEATSEGMAVGPMAVGVLVATVSGIVAIKAMIRVVVDQKLKWFAYYVWVLGAAIILYSVFFMK
ncbi:MAG: undecaprenyl-diphosphate phosphatase [Eubacterium sp.]|nr:undecaprenyl-diphosphate phosphatase [Eubacterium sp.]